MGWKSTRTITRQKALELIMSRLLTATDSEVADAVESLGFGENTDLPYYGHNFMIGDEEDQVFSGTVCEYYQPDKNSTAMNCINCGMPAVSHR